MNEIDKKISAFYDGELSESESKEIIKLISSDIDLQKKFSSYSLISDTFDTKVVEVNEHKIRKNPLEFWFSNVISAAASVLITLLFVTEFDYFKFGEDSRAKKSIELAISNSNNNQTENDDLINYVLMITNEVTNNKSSNVDLTNVGFQNKKSSNFYTKGDESFYLNIEKNRFGISSIKYWKKGDKILYLLPLSNNRILTLYGKINPETVKLVANTLK